MLIKIQVCGEYIRQLEYRGYPLHTLERCICLFLYFLYLYLYVY